MDNAKTFVVTGGTSGLGLEAVRRLATDERNRIIVGARDPARAEELHVLRKTGRVHIETLDTSSLASVRSFAARLEETLGAKGAIAGIACNAGIQSFENRLSPDGFDLTFATNHLGHFLLAHRLLPRLAPGAAIISTASGTHNPHDPLTRRFGFRGGLFTDAASVAAGRLGDTANRLQVGRDRYATSKLCNILFTFEMARRFPAALARFIAFDPGLMPGTGLAREFPAPARFAWKHVLPAAGAILPGVSSVKRSGEALARLLSDPALAPDTGLHFDYRLRQTEPWDQARRRDWAKALYDHSAALCGLTERADGGHAGNAASA